MQPSVVERLYDEVMDIVDIVSENIYVYMNARKMSVAQLAKRSGVSARTINYALSKEGNITIRNLYFIAKGLGVSPANLVEKNKGINAKIINAATDMSEPEVDQTIDFINYIKSKKTVPNYKIYLLNNL